MGKQVVGVGRVRRLRHIVVNPLQLREYRTLLGPEAGVNDDGQVALFAHRPEAIPVRVEEGWHPTMVQVTRAVGASEAVVGDPFQFFHRDVHIDTRSDSRSQEEPVESETEVVRRPPVPGPCAGLPCLQGELPVCHVVEQVPQTVVAQIHELGRDSLAIHVGHPQHRVVEPLPSRTVDLFVLGVDAELVLGAQKGDGEWVELVVLAQAGEQIVEPALEIRGPQLLGHPCMGVRRNDDDSLDHDTPSADDAAMAAAPLNYTLYSSEQRSI